MTAHLITVFADLPILIAMTLIGQGEWEGLRVEGLGLKLTIQLSVVWSVIGSVARIHTSTFHVLSLSKSVI